MEVLGTLLPEGGREGGRGGLMTGGRWRRVLCWEGEGWWYNLRVQEALAPPPVILGPGTPLEEALLRLCAEKSEVVVVATGGGREGGREQRLVGVAVLKDLMSALERWYDQQRAAASASAARYVPPSRLQQQQQSEGGAAVTDDSPSSSLPSSSYTSPSLLEDTDLDVLQAALTQVVATVDAAERAQALAEVLRQLRWSTGLTLLEVVAPAKRSQILYADDKAIKARDLLSTRGLALLPVVSGREGGREGGVVLGVVDQASIRAAIARRETVEMVSRSVVDIQSSLPSSSPSSSMVGLGRGGGGGGGGG